MSVTTILALLLLVGDGRAPTVQNTRSECGVALAIPRSWQLRQAEWGFGFPKPDCSFGLKPRTWDKDRANSEYNISEYAIWVGVSRDTIEHLCKEEVVCDREDQWSIEGRAGMRWPARRVTFPDRTIIIGESEVGAYGKHGGYRGSAQAFVAFIEMDGRMIQMIADGAMTDEELFTRIVQSAVVPPPN